MAFRPSNSNRVAIVGASSLRGKELNQVLEERNFPTDDIVLLDESVMAGTLTEARGEPTFIHALDPESFDGVRFAFFAGASLDAERNWLNAQRAGATVIDMAGGLTASGHTTPWIPSLTAFLPPKAGAATNGSAVPSSYFSPPASVVIASTLATGLGNFQPQRFVLTLFPPVSERDQAGVEELETQTTNLLSFRPIQQTIFDAQVAFNLLAGYGPESKPSLAQVRSEIMRDVTHYLAGRAPAPAIQLIQAPIFYGYAFSAYAEFGSPQRLEELEEPIAAIGVRIQEPDEPPPTNVSVAGESEIHMARIEADAHAVNGFWLWGVADNLRLGATNAVRIAEEILASSAN